MPREGLSRWGVGPQAHWPALWVVHSWVVTLVPMSTVPFWGLKTPNRPGHILSPTLGQPRATEKSSHQAELWQSSLAWEQLTRDSTEPEQTINCLLMPEL